MVADVLIYLLVRHIGSLQNTCEASELQISVSAGARWQSDLHHLMPVHMQERRWRSKKTRLRS